METEEMGRVLIEAKVENLSDLYDLEKQQPSNENVRRITISNALVDTDATLLSLPTHIIQQLGLKNAGSKRVTSSIGNGEADMYSAVRLTIMDRSCTMDVMEVPDDVPPLIGQIPLEHLDLVIDMREHKLIGNPAHGDEHVYELY